MLRALLIGLGALFIFGMIAASMVMNFLFGFGFGTTFTTALVWGALSVASDGLKSVLPVLIAYQARQRHWVRVAAGLLILPLVVHYGFLSALGFWAESRALIVDGRSQEKADLKEAEAELARARTQLAGLPAYRLAGVIDAEMAGLQRERLWENTNGCRQAAGPAARTFCKRFDALVAERAHQQEGLALARRIEVLQAEIRAANARGAWRQVDPLAETIAAALGQSVSRVKSGFSWLAAILVETVSCLGLLVIEGTGLWAGMRAKTATPAVVRQQPWRLVGKDMDTGPVQAGARG